MSVDEVIEIIEKYRKIVNDACEYKYDTYSAASLLTNCKQLKALGFEWGQKLPSGDFKMMKHYYINNDDVLHGEWAIVWDNGGCGAYQFVRGNHAYFAVQEDYKEFMEELMSYGPKAWTSDVLIFDIEAGKRLMADYEDILKKYRGKMEESIKKSRLEKAKKEYERALKDLEENNAD